MSVSSVDHGGEGAGEEEEEEVVPVRSLKGLPELFCVELPGVLKDGCPDGAVQALGGWEAIRRIMADTEGNNSRLKLKLRGGHGGEVSSSVMQMGSNLLCNDQGEVVAAVTQSVRFSSLADFSYQDRGNRDLAGLSQKVLDPSAEDIAVVRPSKLCRFDHVRLDGGFKGLFRTGEGTETPRKVFAAARYDDETVPSEGAEEPIAGTTNTQPAVETLDRLKQLFEQRPLWTRSRLTHELTDAQIKDLHAGLRIVAYRFVGSGPFRWVWIRLGFDPRRNPQMRIYQSTELRFRRVQQVTSVWTERFLIPNRLVDRDEARRSKRERITFQLCDVGGNAVQNSLARAKLRSSFVKDTAGWFEPESLKLIYATIKQQLFETVGYEPGPRGERRRRPMMEKFRLRMRRNTAAAAAASAGADPSAGELLEEEEEEEEDPATLELADDDEDDDIEEEEDDDDAEEEPEGGRGRRGLGPAARPGPDLPQEEAEGREGEHEGDSYEEFEVLDDDSEDDFL